MDADPYSILELPWGASPSAIRRSFRQLALRYHPDRNPGDRRAEAKFKRVSAAYHRLERAGWTLPRPVAAPPRRAAPAATEERTPEDAWPSTWPDGSPIHYPTQADIDAILRGTRGMEGLRRAHDLVIRAVAYSYFIGIVLALLWFFVTLLVALVKAL